MESLQPDDTRSASARSATWAAAAHFSKHFTEEWLFRATLRNSLRAWVAARRSSYLRVPQVLQADHRALRIDYELLAGWHPLRTLIRHRSFGGFSDAELRRLFWTIGAALEGFHRHTHRIHGDFDFDNIFIKRGAEKVVFIDFTPPEYARYRRYNEASPYRDIATFVLFVRAKYPIRQLHLAFRPQLPGLARAFMDGYFRTARAEYDRYMLERCMNELLETTYLADSFSVRFLRHTRLFRTDDLTPRH
jgi:RIO-like serine/threonine protein kinase